MKFPVIVLIDNDKGAGEIFSLMKSRYNSQVNLTTNALFYPVCANLVLVKTPEIGTSGESKIEDFFAQEVVDVKLNGKVFSTAKKIDPAKEYGKTAFAENVVIPNKNKIDFSKFAPILARISSAIGSYRPPP
jgi:RNA-directed DNA polymerase